MNKLRDSWLVKTYIAHRGLHGGGVIENSIPAFSRAIDKKYAIELDVHRLADGNIVVFHDYNLKRLTGLDEIIENLDIVSIKKLRLCGTDETIPTIEEVLNLVHGRVPLLIEIKDEAVGKLEATLWQILKKYKGEYAIQSFNPSSVLWFKKNAPFVYRGQLSYSFDDLKGLSSFKKRLLKKMRLNFITKPHFIGYRSSDLPCKYINRRKYVVLSFTVNTQSEYDRIKPYCDNIIFEGFSPSD